MNGQAAIVTVDLTKHYGDVQALIDLNLEVNPGEVFGFLGPNGAGKTTMIRTILDEIQPTAGRASILGMDSHKEAVEIRRHIGYLPGDLALTNGAHWSHLTILFGAAGLFVAVAVISFNSRDLRERAVGAGFIGRLRNHHATHSIIERLEGSARVSRISVVTASEHRGSLIVAG